MKSVDEFLRKQIASTFFVVPGAQLATMALNKEGDFRYTVKDEDGYIYLRGYSNVKYIDYILSLIADAYGTKTITFQYWQDVKRAIEKGEFQND